MDLGPRDLGTRSSRLLTDALFGGYHLSSRRVEVRFTCGACDDTLLGKTGTDARRTEMIKRQNAIFFRLLYGWLCTTCNTPVRQGSIMVALQSRG